MTEIICYCPVCGRIAIVERSKGSYLYRTAIACNCSDKVDPTTSKEFKSHSIFLECWGATQSAATRKAVDLWRMNYGWTRWSTRCEEMRLEILRLEECIEELKKG